MYPDETRGWKGTISDNLGWEHVTATLKKVIVHIQTGVKTLTFTHNETNIEPDHIFCFCLTLKHKIWLVTQTHKSVLLLLSLTLFYECRSCWACAGEVDVFTKLWLQLRTRIHQPKKTEQQTDKKTKDLQPFYLEAFRATVEAPVMYVNIHGISISPTDPVRPRTNETWHTDPTSVMHSASGHMAICLLGHEICLQHRGDTLSSFTSCSHFFVRTLWTVSTKWFVLSLCMLALVKATKVFFSSWLNTLYGLTMSGNTIQKS